MDAQDRFLLLLRALGQPVAFHVLGRQVDGSVGALDALVEVREAVDPETAVLMDSGIRTGADVLKALALGANAVLIGRPYAYGLAAGGQDGVEAVIRQLAAEVKTTARAVSAQLGYRAADNGHKAAGRTP